VIVLMPETRLRRHAVPAYFHPQENPDDWARLALSSDVGLVVVNIVDGPGIVREERWASVFGDVRAAGAAVVGYIDAGYLGLTGLLTRRGSNGIDDWLEQLLHDIATWYRLYGDSVNGIFIDQVAESDDGASLAPVYRRLRKAVRQHDPSAVTVMNPGATVPAAFANIADVLVTFEGTCDDYLAEGPTGGFESLSWQPGPEQAIWHVVHHTPDAARAAAVLALSQLRGADLLYVTDGSAENPYSSLPSSEIWARSTSVRTAVLAVHAPPAHSCRTVRPSAAATPLHSVEPEISPESTLISNPTLSRHHHTIEASADFVVTSSSRRVFLASSRRKVPRWWTGSSPQIAADWMIENNCLYAYAGSGTDWTWTPSGQVAFEALGGRARWLIEADRIGLAHGGEAEAAFHVSAPGHREYSAVTDV
jgi:Spherulation-specific family 4